MTMGFQRYIDATESWLRQHLATPRPDLADLYGMMAYHLGWRNSDLSPAAQAQGKRLRPVFCLLSCEAAAGEWETAVPYAAAIELVHNFSLIHDDIEDYSQERRHRPTLWSVWGIAHGINTGDAMWCLARTAVYGLLEAGQSPANTLAAAVRLDQTCLKLCQGQFLDISFETRQTVTTDEYLQMIAGKTAALLSACTLGGAALAGASDGTVQALGSFGHELGIIYQIVDDILGIWGDPAVTGKPAATDILTRKKTLPILYALEWEAMNGLDDLQKALADRNAPPDVPSVVTLLERAGALTYAQEAAEDHRAAMLQSLDQAELAGQAAHTLRELAVGLISRQF